ncbi:hypothetical protein OHA77_30430 [Streptosporangium sp. NBC_01639]|uniref:hypothetical protein n=1 Tax=unclassified Streptosporangium TaxID=2632669 RepID=UPI002DDA85A7|nr:hypothetical protein [Streptosporangium sp. NBC_01756]WSC88353.1 hypothetical protein OIE48_09260 [Streptosporangium sp. NBC_01756]WTD52946.1 hypothetical protein OHA77_30430 [Streptosporangium sp. NBC_01639]
MNDFQTYTFFRSRHAELIAEAEIRRNLPKHPGASRRRMAEALHGLADRISPAAPGGHGRRSTPRMPTTA